MAEEEVKAVVKDEDGSNAPISIKVRLAVWPSFKTHSRGFWEPAGGGVHG